MRIVVFSGGTATNSLVPCFNRLARASQGAASRDTSATRTASTTTYIIPVSDDGGSTSEILRCFGGLAVGDLRNRALVLFQDEGAREFLHHRLSKDARAARAEWVAFLEGTHELWRLLDQSPHRCKSVILESLHVFEEIQSQRAVTAPAPAPGAAAFNFSTASLGNIVLKALEMQYGMDEALHKFLRLGGVRDDEVSIMPCVTMQSAGDAGSTSGACASAKIPAPRLDLQLVLSNGDVITGQSEISHPSGESQLYFSKVAGAHPRLAAAVQQLHYVIRDPEPTAEPHADASACVSANTRAIASIAAADLIVYSIGSLITSLMPSLIVPEIAAAIAANTAAHKVLLQNGTYDRESYGLSCEDYTSLVVSTLQKAIAAAPPDSCDSSCDSNPQFITHVIRLADSEIVSRRSSSSSSSSRASTASTASSASSAGTQTILIPSDGNRLYDPHKLYQTLRDITQ